MSQMPHRGDELAFDLRDRLHKSMRVAGLSTGQLARKLDVHRNTISNYLSGRTPADRRTLMAWAMACGVPVEWLETGQAPTHGGPGPGPGGEEAPLPWNDSNVQPFGQTFPLIRAA